MTTRICFWVCSSLNDIVILVLYHQMNAWQWITNWKGVEGICLGLIENITLASALSDSNCTTNFNQESWSQDSNQAPPKHKTEALPLEITCCQQNTQFTECCLLHSGKFHALLREHFRFCWCTRWWRTLQHEQWATEIQKNSCVLSTETVNPQLNMRNKVKLKFVHKIKHGGPLEACSTLKSQKY